MDNIEIAKGDYGYNIDLTVKTKTNVVYDLTTYTAVHLKMWAPEEPTTLLIDKACVVDEPLDGTCHYVIALGDFDTPGAYYAELELTKSGAKESTAPFTIVVIDSK